MSSNEQQRMANIVLLATLSIPLPSAHPEFDRFIETDKTPQEKAQKLAILLGLLQPPTRMGLLKDIMRLNVVTFAATQLQNLYTWLEVDFHPLELCEKVSGVIKVLKQEETGMLLQYIPALQDVTLVRLIHQVSQVYQTIDFVKLLELARFSDAFHLERLIVDCVRYNDMQIRIDHGKKCVFFGVDLSEAQREDRPDGPILQSMPSEQIRCQLVNMATVLYRALNIIMPNKRKQMLDKYRTAAVDYYHETKLKEHQRILGRHKIIEERKEYIEHMNTVREEEELRRQEEVQRAQMAAEQKRLEQEREERERKRQQSEIQLIKDRNLKEKMQQISQTSHGQKILKKLDEDEIKKLDAEQIAVREAEELQKERKEMQQKLKSQEKKIDYLERAKRIEEVSLLQKAMEVKIENCRKRWDQQESERTRAAVTEREEALATRSRLARIQQDNDIFLEKILAERKTAFLKKMQEYEVLYEQEKEKRLQERKIQRKHYRKKQWEQEQAEAAEKKRLEELKARQEEERKRLEEERLKREEEENERRKKEEAKEAERLAKLEKQAEIKRQKELEIERKLEEEKLKTQVDNKPRETSWRTNKSSTDQSSWRARDFDSKENIRRDRRDYYRRDDRNDRDRPLDRKLDDSRSTMNWRVNTSAKETKSTNQKDSSNRELDK